MVGIFLLLSRIEYNFFNMLYSINWRENSGFAGEIQQVKLKPGTRIDRYGGEGGSYISPKGTPFEERAL